MKNENIIKLEIDNKKKHLEKYLRSQWSWKTYFFIFSLISILTLILELKSLKIEDTPLLLLLSNVCSMRVVASNTFPLSS